MRSDRVRATHTHTLSHMCAHTHTHSLSLSLSQGNVTREKVLKKRWAPLKSSLLSLLKVLKEDLKELSVVA